LGAEQQAFKVIHYDSLQEKLDTCVLLKILLCGSLPLQMPEYFKKSALVCLSCTHS